MLTAMCLRLNSFPSLDSFRVYGNEDDATKDLAEFSLANATYAALPSKVTLVNRVLGTTVLTHYYYHPCSSPFLFSQMAMDDASKNAKDMIGSLQMKYNRARQAAITNELIDDIITSKFIPSPYTLQTIIELGF